MGLFAQLPEEPTEWAGLPDEPLRPRSRAEVLPDADAPEAAPDALLGLSGASIASLVVPVDVPPEAPPSAEDDA